MLHASAAAWNRGDLEAFLADYAADATFVGATGLIRGVDEIRRRYQAGFWQTGRPRDDLRFEVLDVRVTAADAAVLVGRYILYDRDSGQTTSTGFFSLAVRKTERGWKILHDHSSEAG